MENIDIIFKNVHKDCLYTLLNHILQYNVDDIVSSHFFDKRTQSDMTYQELDDFPNFFDTANTCNIYLEQLNFGIVLKKVIILVSFDENAGDVTLNFNDVQFEEYSDDTLMNAIEQLVQWLGGIKDTFEMESVMIGYEPGDDEDMKLVEISTKEIRKYNEFVFVSPFAKGLYRILQFLK